VQQQHQGWQVLLLLLLLLLLRWLLSGCQLKQMSA
jgi:hypothetical protein